MLIPTLLAACLLGEPEAKTNEQPLADPGSERATPVAFDASAWTGLVDPPDFVVPPDLVSREPLPRKSDETSFSYTYAEAGYSVTHLDALDHNAQAVYLNGSFAFLRFFHVIAGLERQETSFDNARLHQFDVGGGVQLPIIDQLDVVGELAYVYNEIDSDRVFNNDTNDGWMAYAGARFMVLPWSNGGLEVNAGFRYTVIDSLLSDRETAAWEFGARAHFLTHMSVGAKYAFMDDDRMAAVDFRFSF